MQMVNKFNSQRLENMNNRLDNAPLNVRSKLAFLWATMLGLWIYADFFQLFTPFKLKSMLELKGPFGEMTPETLIFYSVLLILPTLMIPASIFVKAAVSRWLNIIMAALYAVISLLIMVGSAKEEWLRFYVLYQIVEVFIFALIINTAWNWPKTKDNE